jgi:hypothetical protein
LPEHVITNPFDDIEYFRQLYDNNIFTPDEMTAEDTGNLKGKLIPL